MNLAGLNGWYPLAGGLAIGLSAGIYLLFDGRVAGISGMAANALGLSRGGSRVLPGLFLAGLLIGTVIAMHWFRHPTIQITSAWPALIAAGLLVGYGTRLGGGCTSGHGVCGLARLSRRSLVATATFMVVAAGTVFLVRHVLGGTS
jgi:uncharacterized membrane protein YedE/YeeE